MKYKGYYIDKDTKLDIIRGTFVDQGYNVYAPFNHHKVIHHSSNTLECKEWIDKQEAETKKSSRYSPVHYSQYWWVLSDKEDGGRYVEVDGKLLRFHTRDEAVEAALDMDDLMTKLK